MTYKRQPHEKVVKTLGGSRTFILAEKKTQGRKPEKKNTPRNEITINIYKLPGTPRPTIYKWLFQLDDEPNLY